MPGRPPDDRYDRALTQLADLGTPGAAAAANPPGIVAQPSGSVGVSALGPFLALVLPAVLGGVAWMLRHDNTSTTRGIASFGTAILAAPTLLVAGVPLRTGLGLYLAAIAMSVALWFAIGTFAAYRAGKGGPRTWKRFWGEYAWMLAAVWIGVVVALGAANLILGRSLA